MTFIKRVLFILIISSFIFPMSAFSSRKKVIDDEEIEMYMVNPKAPCFIKDAKKTYLYLILPVNFNAVR